MFYFFGSMYGKKTVKNLRTGGDGIGVVDAIGEGE